MWPHSQALAGVGWGLQANGYPVLRFLAEDVAKDLDSVLDGILRSLSHRQTTALIGTMCRRSLGRPTGA